MKILNYFLIIFIFLNSPIKADSNEVMISELQKGGKLIFIRHAYAPGGGDPSNFDINNCETQRNLTMREEYNLKILEIFLNKTIFQ